MQRPYAITEEISTEAADKNEIVTYNITITNNDESSKLSIENLEITIPTQLTLINPPSNLKKEEVEIVKELLGDLESLLKKTGKLTTKDITTAIDIHNNSLPNENNKADLSSLTSTALAVQTYSKTIKPKSKNQV